MTKNIRQATKEQIRDHIIETVRKQKPKTAKQLTNLIKQKQALPETDITELLIELESENKIYFPKEEPPTHTTFKEYVFSSKAAWYWITTVLAAVTTITVFAIPESDLPLVYLRYSLGIIFVLFLPGFAFIKALFPSGVPIKASSENVDTIERVALGFGMSLALSPMVGLILNYTPWGIQLTPITLSLLALTLVCATAAVLREHQFKISKRETTETNIQVMKNG